MSSSKILSLITLSKLPSDLQKLLDEPISVLKGAEDADVQALEKQGLKKIKDLVEIKDLGKIQQAIDPLMVEKLVTSAKIIGNFAEAKGELLGKKVVIVGGGNTAIDAARSVLRLGAEQVTIVYRRSRAEMPAYDWDVDAAEGEGVKLELLAQPIEAV